MSSIDRLGHGWMPALIIASLMPIPLIAQSAQRNPRDGASSRRDASQWRGSARDAESTDSLDSSRIRPNQTNRSGAGSNTMAPRRVVSDDQRGDYDDNDD